MLVIDPDECIDCNLCVPECPVDAIYADDDVPEEKKEFIQLNADLSKNWPPITVKKESPPDADQWKEVTDKRQYLEENWEETSRLSHLREQKCTILLCYFLCRKSLIYLL
jgi:ferredoxin